MNKLSSLGLTGLLLGLLTGPLLALPDDREKEIHVEANSSEAFINEGLIIYYGSDTKPAVITQGSMRIEGQEITVKRQDGELRRITATGAPARFQQQPEVDRAIVYGQANKLIYEAPGETLELEENADLEQDDNRMRGHYITYDMAEGHAQARSSSGDDRINMTIQPDNAQ